jgi:hypothetical protein
VNKHKAAISRSLNIKKEQKTKMPPKKANKTDLPLAATKRTPAQIRCGYCGQFAHYGEAKCPHCGGKLDYADKTNIVYEESFDLKAYNKSLELSVKAKKKSSASRKKGIAKGCLISFLSVAVFIVVIAVIANSVGSDSGKISEEPAKNVLAAPVSFEKDGVTITVNEFVNDVYRGEGLSVTIDNGTNGKIRVYSEFAVVNGITFESGYFASSDIGAGKSSTETVFLYDYESVLELAGTLKTIELVFEIKDQDYNSVWKYEHISVSCNPDQPEPAAAEIPGRLVLDRLGVQVYVADIRTRDSSFALVAELVIVNNSGADVRFSINRKTFFVNEVALSPHGSAYVADGTAAYLSVSLTKKDLSSNNITAVGSIKSGFEVSLLKTGGYLFVSEPLPLTEDAQAE